MWSDFLIEVVGKVIMAAVTLALAAWVLRAWERERAKPKSKPKPKSPPKRRRSRLLRVAKWTGTIVCGLIVAVSVWSGWYFARFSPTMAFKQDYLGGEPIPNNFEAVYVAGGTVSVRWVRWSARERYAAEYGNPSAKGLDHDELPTFWVQRFDDPPRFYFWPPWFNDAAPSQPDFLLPLWIPFLLVLVPTICLWRLDRRTPHGHCATCGYDLTGNESGRCPECGAAVERA